MAAMNIKENPTDKALEVAITLDFHFTHALLSHERVTSKLVLQPGEKKTVPIIVNTLAVLGNRKVNSVEQLDVTTKPK